MGKANVQLQIDALFDKYNHLNDHHIGVLREFYTQINELERLGAESFHHTSSPDMFLRTLVLQRFDQLCIEFIQIDNNKHITIHQDKLDNSIPVKEVEHVISQLLDLCLAYFNEARAKKLDEADRASTPSRQAQQEDDYFQIDDNQLFPDSKILQPDPWHEPIFLNELYNTAIVEGIVEKEKIKQFNALIEKQLEPGGNYFPKLPAQNANNYAGKLKKYNQVKANYIKLAHYIFHQLVTKHQFLIGDINTTTLLDKELLPCIFHYISKTHIRKENYIPHQSVDFIIQRIEKEKQFVTTLDDAYHKVQQRIPSKLAENYLIEDYRNGFSEILKHLRMKYAGEYSSPRFHNQIAVIFTEIETILRDGRINHASITPWFIKSFDTIRCEFDDRIQAVIKKRLRSEKWQIKMLNLHFSKVQERFDTFDVKPILLEQAHIGDLEEGNINQHLKESILQQLALHVMRVEREKQERKIKQDIMHWRAGTFQTSKQFDIEDDQQFKQRLTHNITKALQKATPIQSEAELLRRYYKLQFEYEKAALYRQYRKSLKDRNIKKTVKDALGNALLRLDIAFDVHVGNADTRTTFVVANKIIEPLLMPANICIGEYHISKKKYQIVQELERTCSKHLKDPLIGDSLNNIIHTEVDKIQITNEPNDVYQQKVQIQHKLDAEIKAKPAAAVKPSFWVRNVKQIATVVSLFTVCTLLTLFGTGLYFGGLKLSLIFGGPAAFATCLMVGIAVAYLLYEKAKAYYHEQTQHQQAASDLLKPDNNPGNNPDNNNVPAPAPVFVPAAEAEVQLDVNDAQDLYHEPALSVEDALTLYNKPDATDAERQRANVVLLANKEEASAIAKTSDSHQAKATRPSHTTPTSSPTPKRKSQIPILDASNNDEEFSASDSSKVASEEEEKQQLVSPRRLTK